MPEYVLNRKHTLRTLHGVISFEKGVPTWVPPAMEVDAKNIGAEPIDGEGVSLLPNETRLPDIPVGTERQTQLFVAFDLLIERNESKEFTGQGVPTTKAVEKIVGFDVERSEVAEAWATYKERKAE